MYSYDTGRIVGNGVVRGGGDEARPMWVQGYLNHHVNFQDLTNIALLREARFSQFSSYLKDTKIYKCPSDRGVVVDATNGKKIAKPRSYAMNCYLGWIDGPGWKPKGPILRKEDCIVSPAEIFVFMDLHPESVCWPFFGVETNDVFFNYPAMHHLGAASVSFADGHVTSRRRLDPRTSDYPQDRAWHDHHQPSPGNTDLAWLRAHSQRE
jgi:prepilin-type processing-associated H-X9-DG protein